MSYNIAEIAERIRSLRLLIGFTPEEMAEATGETVENYTAYENGGQDFPFGFLYHCAEKFNVDIVELLTGENPRLSGYNLVRRGEGLPIERMDSFDYYHLAPKFRDKLAEPFFVCAPYREEDQFRPVEYSQHEGNEFDFVLTGKLRFYYEGHTEVLNPGDAIYYNSGKPHGLVAIDGADCTFLAVVVKKHEEGEGQ